MEIQKEIGVQNNFESQLSLYIENKNITMTFQRA